MQLDVQVNIQYTLYIVRFVNNNNNNMLLFINKSILLLLLLTKRTIYKVYWILT